MKWLWGLVAAIALPIAVSWPTILAPGERTLGIGHMDQRGHIWATWNMAQSLAYGLHTPLNFYPDGQNLLVMHGGHLDLLVGALFVHLGASPLAAHNLTLLTFLGFSVLAGYALGLRLTGSPGAALYAGAATVLSPYVLKATAQGLAEEVAVGGIALAVLGLLDATARPGWRGPVTLAVAVVLTTLASWEYGMFLALLVALWVVAVRLGGDPAAAPGWFRRVFGGCVAAAGALSPLTIPFLLQMRAARAELAASLPEAADPAPTAALVIGQSIGVDSLFGAVGYGPVLLLVPAALALVGLWRRPTRRERILSIVLFAFLVLAMGPVVKWAGEAVRVDGRVFPLPFAALQAALPFLTWFYWPNRLLSVAGVALAALGAGGVHWLGQKARIGAVPVALVAVALTVVQGARAQPELLPTLPHNLLGEPPQAYACLASRAQGPILEAPFPPYGIPTLLGHPQPAEEHTLNLRLNNAVHSYRWWQTFHGRPLLVGVDAPHTVPAAWRARAAADPTLAMLALASAGIKTDAAPPADAAQRLAAFGAVAVVVHDDVFPRSKVWDAVHAWLTTAYGTPVCQQRPNGWRVYMVGDE